MKLRTILIDDQVAALYRLEQILNHHPEIELIAQVTDPRRGLEIINSQKPEIVFVDVEMPKMSGFELVEQIKANGHQPIIVFTTAYEHYAIKAIKKQAFDYLLKPIDIDEVEECIRKIITNRNNHSLIIPKRIKELLSPRELEIIELLREGKSSRDIGGNLFISKSTVDTHRRNILEKTGYDTTNQLISDLLITD
jgi:DNA-binding NarL/FixJ family response regulator